MRAGRLRHRVTIQTRSTTPEADGGQPATWTDGATVWAGVEPIAGREMLRADAAAAEVSHRVWMRWRAGVTPANRLKLGTRTFEIVAAINAGERDRDLEILAKELVG